MIQIRPKVEKHFMYIKILGLRDLESDGIMSVQVPFIKFDFSCLLGWMREKDANFK